MSVTGITSINSAQLTNFQSNFQKVQSEFKQLGQDLQSGNLTQAQADFITLSQSLTSPPNFVGPNAVTQSPNAQSASSAHHSSHHRVHLHQALSQLGQALQAGNLSVAQRAFATMEQIWQRFAGGASSGTGSTQASPVNVSA